MRLKAVSRFLFLTMKKAPDLQGLFPILFASDNLINKHTKPVLVNDITLALYMHPLSS